MLKLKPLEMHLLCCDEKTELLSSRKLKPVHVMQTTVHALPAIIPFKFPAVMHLFCTCACIQLVTDDYVIMNPCTRQQMATHAEQ